MSLCSMEKGKTRDTFKTIPNKKNFEDRFLFEIVVSILRCISLRVLNFCSPSDEISYLSYCFYISSYFLSFTRQILFVHSDHWYVYRDIYFVIFRVRILIIAFLIDVLFFLLSLRISSVLILHLFFDSIRSKIIFSNRMFPSVFF